MSPQQYHRNVTNRNRALTLAWWPFLNNLTSSGNVYDHPVYAAILANVKYSKLAVCKVDWKAIPHTKSYAKKNEEHQISVPIQLVVKDALQRDAYTNDRKKSLFTRCYYA